MARTATPVVANKFPGKCTDCGDAVPAGTGVAIKTEADKRWQLRCFKDAPETHGALNPWRADHHVAEQDYTGGEYTRGRARQMVNNEYRDTDMLAEKCECGGICWWRATVGARMCPDCRTMVVYKIDKDTGKTIRKLIK